MTIDRITKIELLTREFFKELFPYEEVIYNHRPDWLKNEKTGRNFELDIYYPNKCIAVEVNGPFHKLFDIQERDQFKKKRCDEVGIKLLVIRSNHGLYTLIKKHPQLNISRKLLNKIKTYRPNKQAFGTRLRKAKYKDRMGYASRKQAEETASVKARMEARANANLKHAVS